MRTSCGNRCSSDRRRVGAARRLGMTTFNEAKHSRDRLGQFSEQTRTEPDVDLAAEADMDRGLKVGRGRAGRSSVGQEFTQSSTKRVAPDVHCETQVTHHVFAVNGSGHQVTRQQHDRTDAEDHRYGVRSQRVHIYTSDGVQLERTTNSTWGEKTPHATLAEAEAAARGAAESADLADHDPQPWAEPFIGPDKDHPEGQWLGARTWDDDERKPDGYSGAELDQRADEAADRYERALDARW